MLFTWLLAAGFVASLGHAQRPTRHRNYDTHDYYALELHGDLSPQAAAARLGLTYENQLGELAGHYTFSAPKLGPRDAEAKLLEIREERCRRKKAKRRTSPEEVLLHHVLWSQKQVPKPRMVKRSPSPARPQPLVVPIGRQAPPQDDMSSTLTAHSTTVSTAEPNVIPTPNGNATDLNPEAVRNAIQDRLDIRDPIFADQWHLYNSVQIGNDLNVTGVWEMGVTGEGATAVMVDDGIDMESEDIKDNYFAKGSYDFNDNVAEPKPRLADDRHGTRCAGEIAAVKNGVCGVGVAYNARIGGLRILSKVITDEDEASAMNYAYQDNQIYSCSWGPPDDGRSMDAPGLLIRKAMVNAIQNGRQGKGNIFVFAAGNGHGSGDNCNFDGYTNSIYSITIGGIDRKNFHGYYSELCSAMLAVTYSSGSGDAIHTTDVGTNQCYSNHGGTSAAAPLAAGVFALALSARPELTWRDLQHITMRTAVQVNNDDDSWDKTYAGKPYSHVFGYGKLDAYAVVAMAKNMTLVKPQAWYKAPWVHVNHTIPQGNEGLLSSFEITANALKEANFEKIEQVTVTMNVEHTRRGDISVELRSPEKVVSHLSVARRLDDAEAGYIDWTFMSVAHWDEPGIGEWSVVVKDTEVNEFNGSLTDWRITLWGSCIDPDKQELLPMPTEHDDDDHAIVSASPTFVSVDPAAPENTGLPVNPTDHQHRPVNAKPTDPGDLSSSTSSASILVPTSTSISSSLSSSESDSRMSTSTTSTTPTSSPGGMIDAEPDMQNGTSSKPNNFLPHYFPTFGVSKRTQVWIYGALVIVILFCAGLGAFLVIQRRKQQRINRDDYEFEELPDQDEITRQRHLLNGGAGGHGKRRAGELYDAFAPGSDEDEDGDNDDDDDNGTAHEDRELLQAREGHGGGEPRDANTAMSSRPYSDREPARDEKAGHG